MIAVYHIPYLCCMVLCGTKDKGLFIGFNVLHELPHTGFITLLDIDFPCIEIILFICLPFFNYT